MGLVKNAAYDGSFSVGDRANGSSGNGNAYGQGQTVIPAAATLVAPAAAPATALLAKAVASAIPVAPAAAPATAFSAKAVATAIPVV